MNAVNHVCECELMYYASQPATLRADAYVNVAYNLPRSPAANIDEA